MQGCLLRVPPRVFVSDAARAYYKWAAVGSSLFLCLLVAFSWMAMSGAHFNAPAIQTFEVLALLGSMFAASMQLAMWYFLFKFDASGMLKKIFWAGLLLMTSPLGSILFFYFVYLPQTAPTPRGEQALAASS